MFAAVVALLAAMPAHAQDNELRLQITRADEADYPNARLFVSVEDETTDAAQFTDANFTVAHNGAPVAIRGVELASSQGAPLDIVFMFDASTSLQGVPIDSAKAAAKTLLAELAPEDRVAIMRFNDDVVQLQDYTQDRALLTTAIDALQATGNTAFYQATNDAAVRIAESPATRKVVVLLSDGAEYGEKSTVTREQALAAAGYAGVPFFIVAFGNEVDRPYLTELAGRTNGRLFEAPGPADLEALYAGIGRLLRSQYVVTFDASSMPTDADSQLTVTLTDGDRTAVADANYRPGAGFLPQLTVTGVTAGESITSPREIEVTVSNNARPRVTWYVDDVNVLEQIEPPYVYTYEPAAFGEGQHVLRVSAGEGNQPNDQTVTFSSTPPAASSGGGSPMLIYIGVGGLVGLVVALLFFTMRRKRKPVERVIPADQRTRSWAQQVADRRASEAATAAQDEPTSAANDAPSDHEDIGEALGKLISRAGNDLGREYSVGGKPVSIGAGARCGVHIADPSLAFEEARIWVRNGHLMLHRFTRLTAVEPDSSGRGWEILEEGDTFSIGQHTFEFRALKEGEQAPVNPAGPKRAVITDPAATNDAQPPKRFSDLMPRAD
jgi:VWFA-related protein